LIVATYISVFDTLFSATGCTCTGMACGGGAGGGALVQPAVNKANVPIRAAPEKLPVFQ
jgi:hypothetical protein